MGSQYDPSQPNRFLKPVRLGGIEIIYLKTYLTIFIFHLYRTAERREGKEGCGTLWDWWAWYTLEQKTKSVSHLQIIRTSHH